MAGSWERFVNESLLEGFSQFHGLQGDGGGEVEEVHIPSCPSLPLSTPVTSPPFSHMTAAVTEKPSTNISSAWIWPQYISLPGSSRALARPALWCLAPCRDWQNSRTRSNFKIHIVQPPLLGEKTERSIPWVQAPPILHHHLYPFHLGQ